MSDDSNWLERLFAGLVRLSASERLLVSLGAIIVATGVGMVVILAAGYTATCETPVLFIFGVEFCYNPVEVYRVLFSGAFGNSFGRATTLQWTTLLLFTGLSFAIPYKAGLFNIGGQGQFVLGSLGSAVAVVWVAGLVPSGTTGRFVLIPVGLFAGALVGGAYGLIPAYLKVRFEMNEVITTLLLNFIATAVAFVFVDRYFDDSTVQGTQTPALPQEATFEPWLFPSSANFSIFVFVFGVVVLVGFYWLLARSRIGYDIQALGTQPKAAVFGGVNERRTTLFSMAMAGIVAGLGGALFVMMVIGRWQTGAPPVGFDGIAVSILAGNSPAGLLPAGLLFGALQSGGQVVQLQTGIPGELVGVLRGLVILLVATPELFRALGRRLDRRGVIDINEGETE
ncbi:ABC transporter permease [Halovenus sp. HT40]|uniref:ABC transporter permease n=1 Tax=Halovenus sp. HT40 TaxID=3126691 RepID=UPI00300EA2E9